MANIVPALPYTINNGDPLDATPVQANFNAIVSGVNSNAVASGGDASSTFNVAPGTSGYQAVNYTQLTNGTLAPVFGTTTVASGTSGNQAVNYTQLTNGTLTPTFGTTTVAPGTSGNQAVNYTQLTNGSINAKFAYTTVNGITNSGATTNTAVNAAVEHGSTTQANSPYIDFHSSGNAIDYDARLIASGGSTAVGQGTLTVMAAAFAIPNGTSGTQAVNFSQFPLSTAQQGYTKLPNGLIIQWGLVGGGQNQSTFSLPIAFPNVFAVIVTNTQAPMSTGVDSQSAAAWAVNLSQYGITTDQFQCGWIAIGW